MDLKNLNKEQIEAVKETEGYIRVIAGAGTGKTKVLVSRYLYLVNDLGISPESILCLTFTRKAKNEMARRIKDGIHADGSFSDVMTYHSFSSMFLRQEIQVLGIPKSFRIFDEYDTYKVLSKIYSNNNVKMDSFLFEDMKDRINRYKEKEDYIKARTEEGREHFLPIRNCLEDIVLDQYLLAQKKSKWLDFDDLIHYTHYILKNQEETRNRWQKRYSYIEVDEAQDTSQNEYDILEMLAEKCQNLFVVGDPDQNIYEWRNSDNRILLDFDKKHPSCKTIILKENYRSTKNILKTANLLISNNKKRIGKDLFTQNEEGEIVHYRHFKTSREETDDIIKEIQNSLLRKEDYKDNAILFRCSFLSQELENRLREQAIPYQMVGAISFYEQSEIQDILALIKIVIEEDDKSLIRMINRPNRHFGKKKLDHLILLQNSCSLYSTLKSNLEDIEFVGSEVGDFLRTIETVKAHLEDWDVIHCINFLLFDSGYYDYVSALKQKSHLDNINAFLFTVKGEAKDGTKLKEYYLGTLKKKEQESTEKNSVSLLTIHASKGLEFKNVYVIGLVEPFFPHYRAVEERKEEGMEEERRLFYVACTRAKKRLFLYSEEDSGYQVKNSVFLSEIKMEEGPTTKPKEKEKAQRPKKAVKRTKDKEDQNSLLGMFTSFRRS